MNHSSQHPTTWCVNSLVEDVSLIFILAKLLCFSSIISETLIDLNHQIEAMMSMVKALCFYLLDGSM